MNKLFYSEKDLDDCGILSRPTRWRMRQAGEFPNPVQISKGRVGYPAALIDAWVAGRIEGQASAA